MKPFSIIVAIDEKNGIGKNGQLAWRLSSDLKQFKEVTCHLTDQTKINAVIMGRKTWESLPEKFKPLPGRLNVVLSQKSNTIVPSGVLIFSSLDQALNELNLKTNIEKVFVIGGAQIFEHAISKVDCQDLYVTHIKGNFLCDTFFPSIPSHFKKEDESSWLSEGATSFRFTKYSKI